MLIVDVGSDYCVEYWDNGALQWKGVRIDNEMYGYQEGYRFDGSVNKVGTGYWLDDKYLGKDINGACVIWNKEAT